MIAQTKLYTVYATNNEMHYNVRIVVHWCTILYVQYTTVYEYVILYVHTRAVLQSDLELWGFKTPKFFGIINNRN